MKWLTCDGVLQERFLMWIKFRWLKCHKTAKKVTVEDGKRVIALKNEYKEKCKKAKVRKTIVIITGKILRKLKNK